VADPAIEYAYRYREASRLDGTADRTLHLATAGGTVEHPRLFRGRVRHPVLFADALLLVGAVARSRFHVPAAMLGRILQLADPVATASHDRLRFEAFSSCASVYARLDLLPAFVDGAFLGSGTTNVDLGADVRAALAGVTDAARLDLEVGTEDLVVEVDGERHEERRVALPERWVRGFAETQAILAGMDRRCTVDGAAFRRFLRDLPRGANYPVFVTESGGRLVLGRRPELGAVAVADADRLRVLDRLAPAIRTMTVYGSGDGASAWSAELADARLTVAISAAAWRGFSGEGRVLDALGRAADPRVRANVEAALAWHAELRAGELAAELAADVADVEAALAELAGAGLVGYDLDEHGYFARRLPFASGGARREQPRLRQARALVQAGAVRLEAARGDAPEGVVAWVTGRSAEYRVRIGPDGRACTCPWWGKHPGDRGPCAHILAVELATSADEPASGRRLDA
jgi:SWIM zinc finger